MRYVRSFLLMLCIFQVMLAAAFILQLRFVVQLWPLPYTNQMSFLFVGSIVMAAAASTFWCVASREYGALTGIALDYLAIFTPLAVFAFQLASATRSEVLRNFFIACVLGILFGLGLWLWSRRIPIRDTRPLPRLVRVSFGVFILALILVGGLLIFKVPNILPWEITGSGSVIYGWAFLGAALYFAYSLFRPSWHNAVGQLAGFLAYDLVLIVPFILMLPTVKTEFRLSLIIYTGVVIYSGVLATYYLFLNPKTRVIRSRSLVLQLSED